MIGRLPCDASKYPRYAPAGPPPTITVSWILVKCLLGEWKKEVIPDKLDCAVIGFSAVTIRISLLNSSGEKGVDLALRNKKRARWKWAFGCFFRLLPLFGLHEKILKMKNERKMCATG